MNRRLLNETINKTVEKVLSEYKEKQLDTIIENVVNKQINLLTERKNTSSKNNRKKRVVLQWLHRDDVNTAAIRRKLEGEPETQSEEDSKRSHFMKKVNGFKDGDKEYELSPDEIDRLLQIKNNEK